MTMVTVMALAYPVTQFFDVVRETRRSKKKGRWERKEREKGAKALKG